MLGAQRLNAKTRPNSGQGANCCEFCLYTPLHSGDVVVVYFPAEWRQPSEVHSDTRLSTEHRGGLLADDLAGESRNHCHADQDDWARQGLSFVRRC